MLSIIISNNTKRKLIKILNAAGFESAPIGNRPIPLTTKQYVHFT